MRILVFEFISGGGLIEQSLPESLLQEGLLMRNALLDDLRSITDVALLILQDERIVLDESRQNKRWQYFTISHGIELQTLLSALQDTYDVVWLIAPESDGVLAFWCHFFIQQGKALATSALSAVEICADKFRTYILLQNADIPCVPSCLINQANIQNHNLIQKIIAPSNAAKAILKVNNSVGCDGVYLFESELDLQNIGLKLKQNGQYIFQPYIAGKVLSLSCLFYLGKAYFICCNEQHMRIEKQQFELLACTVNVQTKNALIYQKLCQQIAGVIPELFGYVGIDFIQTVVGENLILEINPRLTTSYVGIGEALGINVAELVLGMLNHQFPSLIKSKNQLVMVDVNQGNLHAG